MKLSQIGVIVALLSVKEIRYGKIEHGSYLIYFNNVTITSV